MRTGVRVSVGSRIVFYLLSSVYRKQFFKTQLICSPQGKLFRSRHSASLNFYFSCKHLSLLPINCSVFLGIKQKSVATIKQMPYLIQVYTLPIIFCLCQGYVFLSVFRANAAVRSTVPYKRQPFSAAFYAFPIRQVCPLQKRIFYRNLQ